MILLLMLACGEAPPLQCAIDDGLPVFPGAEGFGTRTPAGRGGAVFEVTSLDDSGPGTLREAMEAEGPRTVVFRTGGTISLKETLSVRDPFLTVAGQTAPGDGILIAGAGIGIQSHDILLQHLRIRPGIDGNVAPAINDAIAIYGSDPKYPTHHIVIDHVSVSWGEDELISVWESHHVTLSWTLAAEALHESRHPQGPHSAGILVGNRSSCTTQHHNLYAHNSFRNPRVGEGGRHDVVNNVAYDYQIAAEVNPVAYAMEVNFVGNQFIPGKSDIGWGELTYTGSHVAHAWMDPSQLLATSAIPMLYVEDNVGPSRTGGDWSIVTEEWLRPGDPARQSKRRFAAPPVTTVSSDEVVDVVLADVGAHPRSEVDERLVQQVRDGTGKLVNDAGPYPDLDPGTPLEDTDHDGMSDGWETANGLDPDDPADGARIREDGYSELEAYLHTL